MKIISLMPVEYDVYGKPQYDNITLFLLEKVIELGATEIDFINKVDPKLFSRISSKDGSPYDIAGEIFEFIKQGGYDGIFIDWAFPVDILLYLGYHLGTSEDRKELVIFINKGYTIVERVEI
jgi:hypothetical protein